MTVVELSIDLALDPTDRWGALSDFRQPARALLASYCHDLGGVAQFGEEAIEAYCEQFVSQEYKQELESVSRIVGLSFTDVVVGNLYYDALKYLIGCTAFAVDTPAGPLHARNLDWWTEAPNVLAESACSRFDRACALVSERRPQNADQCMAILDDSQVRMEITVQQIVFTAYDGEVFARLPR